MIKAESTKGEMVSEQEQTLTVNINIFRCFLFWAVIDDTSVLRQVSVDVVLNVGNGIFRHKNTADVVWPQMNKRKKVVAWSHFLPFCRLLMLCTA